LIDGEFVCFALIVGVLVGFAVTLIDGEFELIVGESVGFTV